jgi:hypothetical protein
LSGKTYTWNDVDGGAKMIAQLGLPTNFYGGNCVKLGLISSLGYWGCLDKNDSKHIRLLGFRIADPKELTELGKKLFQEFYSNFDVVFSMKDDIPKTPEDLKLRAKLEARAQALEINPVAIKGVAIDTLKSLVDATEFELRLESDKTKKADKKPVPADPANDLIKKATRKKVTAKASA